MKKEKDRMIGVLAVLLGVIIFIKPEFIAWILAVYLILWGLSRFF
jgi:hypothetical protein